MKPGDIIIPAAMGDGSSVVVAVAGGAAWRCPSMSRRGSPPPSSAIAVEKLPLGTYDDVAGAAGGLPVSRCTTVMNSCGLAWMTLGVCSYRITGPGAAAVGGPPTPSSSTATRGLLAGRGGGDDDDAVPGRLSGSGLGPCRLLTTPLLAFAAADDDDMVVLCCIIIGRSIDGESRRFAGELRSKLMAMADGRRTKQELCCWSLELEGV